MLIAAIYYIKYYNLLELRMNENYYKKITNTHIQTHNLEFHGFTIGIVTLPFTFDKQDLFILECHF